MHGINSKKQAGGWAEQSSRPVRLLLGLWFPPRPVEDTNPGSPYILSPCVPCLCAFVRTGPTVGISYPWLQRAWTEPRWTCEQRGGLGVRPLLGVFALGKIRCRCPQVPRGGRLAVSRVTGHQDERDGCCTLNSSYVPLATRLSGTRLELVHIESLSCGHQEAVSEPNED